MIIMTFLYTPKHTKFPKWSKENYFIAIKKLVEAYSIKLDYDTNILSQKSYKELKLIYRELQLQTYATKPHEISYGKRNIGNQFTSNRGTRKL